MMNTIPFTYGRIAVADDFTNRTAELEQLKRNFTAGINTILISPRRWGKSSLVKKASMEVTSQYPDIKVCRLDIFNVRSEEEFYLTLANAVINATSSGWEEVLKSAKEFLSRLVPRIELSPDMQSSVSFGVNLEELKKEPDEILNLAENIAIKKNLRIIVCVDEFQSISRFPHSEDFQKKLRSVWQHHQSVSYCLYGSKRHMLLDIFTNYSMPFYKFGDLMFLQKIDNSHWIPFIKHRFNDTGKEISDEDALLITELTDCHSYYVQQLSQQVWFRTDKICSEEIVKTAHQALVDQLSMLFADITDRLNTLELNLIKAIIAGEKQLSSKETMQKYNLGTSAGVVRQKKVLFEKEIIDEINGEIVFIDPLYQYWLGEKMKG